MQHIERVIKRIGYRERECFVIAIVGSAASCRSSATDNGTGLRASFAVYIIPASVELVLALASSAEE